MIMVMMMMAMMMMRMEELPAPSAGRGGIGSLRPAREPRHRFKGNAKRRVRAQNPRLDETTTDPHRAQKLYRNSLQNESKDDVLLVLRVRQMTP